MKKLLIVLLGIILIAVVGGYYLTQTNPTIKSAVTVNKVLNAKTPTEVKQIITDNQDVVQELEKQGVLKDSDLQKINTTLDNMEKQGKTFDKKEIAETYLKGKIPQDQYNQVVNIISKENITMSDKVELGKLLLNKK